MISLIFLYFIQSSESPEPLAVTKEQINFCAVDCPTFLNQEEIDTRINYFNQTIVFYQKYAVCSKNCEEKKKAMESVNEEIAKTEEILKDLNTKKKELQDSYDSDFSQLKLMHDFIHNNQNLQSEKRDISVSPASNQTRSVSLVRKNDFDRKDNRSPSPPARHIDQDHRVRLYSNSRRPTSTKRWRSISRDRDRRQYKPGFYRNRY